jgi:cytochrome c-type biogenesis protein CcmE
VARRRSPVRLVVALSVAAVLAIFLLYTSIAGGGTPSLQPSQIAGREGKIALAGVVVGSPRGDARGDGLRFALRDIEGRATVPVVYRGSVPDQFKRGRQIYLEGELRNGTFVGTPDTLVTKCPSKYAPKQAA